MAKYKKKTTAINAIQHKNPMDDYPDLETTIANLKDKQNSDSMITEVIKCLDLDSEPTADTYSTEEQFRPPFTGDGTLYRRYLAHDGTMFYKCTNNCVYHK